MSFLYAKVVLVPEERARIIDGENKATGRKYSLAIVSGPARVYVGTGEEENINVCNVPDFTVSRLYQPDPDGQPDENGYIPDKLFDEIASLPANAEVVLLGRLAYRRRGGPYRQWGFDVETVVSVAAPPTKKPVS